jgi:succinate dehydrogenase / fumarate reductase iron-sulfur subunit
MNDIRDIEGRPRTGLARSRHPTDDANPDTDANARADPGIIELRIYRYDPDTAQAPRMQRYYLPRDHRDRMVLDLLMRIKGDVDDSLSFRRSCREGVCGSDGMNINGKNRLACLTNIRAVEQPIILRPLPGMPVVRDLIVDLSNFWKQYHSITPWLVNHDPPPERERLQTPQERDQLDGLYECILCACCSSSCPSFWWNPDKFVGPAGLLQAYRFIADSRDQATAQRLDNVDDVYRLFRCRTIMNCTDVCPKNLSPAAAIGEIRSMLARRIL